MDINLTDAQFLCALLIGIIILFVGIYSYLIVTSKYTSGVKLLDDVDIKVHYLDDTITIFIDNNIYETYFTSDNYHTIRIIEINGISYDFFYYHGYNCCIFSRTNSKGIYECKRVNVNFK